MPVCSRAAAPQAPPLHLQEQKGPGMWKNRRNGSRSGNQSHMRSRSYPLEPV